MVCLGNICRSPMAEGILRHKLDQHNINAEVDSAGFEPFHKGDPPDRRSVEITRKYGIDISGTRSRLFNVSDFDHYDKIFVMDKRNYMDVMYEARNEDDKEKVDFLLNQINPESKNEVPDPYYGGNEGFENVFRLINQACDKIIIDLRTSK